MKKQTLLVLLFSAIFVLTGCSQISKENAYNQDSRKTTIPQTCKSFFDGCNNCNRMDNPNASCTKMYCETYQEPKCLDTK